MVRKENALISAREVQTEPSKHPPDARREGPLDLGGRPHPRRGRPSAIQVLLRAIPERQISER